MADGSDGSVSPDPSALIGGQHWLLKAKVIAPEPPGKYVRRASLRPHLDGVLERRLTALQAPAGFGKTTVLADVVRDRRDHGFIAAWISLDDDDTPNVVCGYLAYAFQHAGLDGAVDGPCAPCRPDGARGRVHPPLSRRSSLHGNWRSWSRWGVASATGYRERPRDNRRGHPLPPQEDLPQDRDPPTEGRGPLRAVVGRPVLTRADPRGSGPVVLDPG